MMMPGTTKNSSRNITGWPLTSHFTGGRKTAALANPALTTGSECSFTPCKLRFFAACRLALTALAMFFNHLFRRAARGSLTMRSLMQKHSRIVAPAQLDRVADIEQLGLTRRGSGQQRFEQRGGGQLGLVQADLTAIQQVAHHDAKVVLQLGQF